MTLLVILCSGNKFVVILLSQVNNLKELFINEIGILNRYNKFLRFIKLHVLF